MIPALRQAFNAAWSERQYEALLAELQQRTAGRIEFPVSETPCFFPQPLIDGLARTGEELIRQALNGEAGRAAKRVVPARFRSPGAGPTPTFLQVDFGLVRGAEGQIEPKLVELQAFPSLYGFQVALAEGYRAAF